MTSTPLPVYMQMFYSSILLLLGTVFPLWRDCVGAGRSPSQGRGSKGIRA